MRRFVLAAFALMLIAACQPTTTELTEEQKAEIEAEVRALDDEGLATVVAWGLEPFLSFFSDDLIYALFGEVHHGLSAWRDQVTPFFEQAPSIENCERDGPYYQVLSSEIVVSTSVGKCVGPAADGSPVVIDHTWTVVWAKRDDQWKIVNMSETYPTPETSAEES